MQAISLTDNSNPLIRRYIRTAKPLLTEPDDIDAYTIALADGSLMEAWQYQRTYSEMSDMRERLIRKILDWCFAREFIMQCSHHYNGSLTALLSKTACPASQTTLSVTLVQL